MEFRFFLPRLLPSEDSAISILHQKYNTILSSLLADFHDGSGSLPEKREDVYLIGNAHFGAKFRAGKKLEVKIRQKKLDLNVEQWKKFKFGKKNVSHYKDDIIQLITEEADQHLPDDVKLIEAEKFLNVQKVRKIQLTDEVSKELCTISSSGDSRQWVSVAVEGSLEDIRLFLNNKKSGSRRDVILMLEALQTAVEIARSDSFSHDAVVTTFIPVVAGYPTWVRVASRNACDPTEVSDILADVDALLSALAFTNTPSSSTDGGEPRELNSSLTPASNSDYCSCMKIC
jgi:hypothetical protein